MSWSDKKPEINLDALHHELRFVCEWCEPSDIPGRLPERCAVLYCPVHHMRCWHWPKDSAMLDSRDSS